MVFNQQKIITLYFASKERTQLIHSTEHVFENFKGIARLLPLNCGISWQDLSASLRNKGCKRLGSRPKPSIKPCYTNWTIK